MPQCAPLSMFLHVIYEISFIRGVQLSKLQFPRFGKLYPTDTEEESSAVGCFGLLHVADITLLFRGWRGLNKNVNFCSIMNSSKRKKKKGHHFMS